MKPTIINCQSSAILRPRNSSAVPNLPCPLLRPVLEPTGSRLVQHILRIAVPRLFHGEGLASLETFAKILAFHDTRHTSWRVPGNIPSTVVIVVLKARF